MSRDRGRAWQERLVHRTAAAAVSLATAEEAKAEEQLLAKLEDKVLKLKEVMSGVLAAQSLELGKLANVAGFLTRSEPN